MASRQHRKRGLKGGAAARAGAIPPRHLCTCGQHVHLKETRGPETRRGRTRIQNVLPGDRGKIFRGPEEAGVRWLSLSKGYIVELPRKRLNLERRLESRRVTRRNSRYFYGQRRGLLYLLVGLRVRPEHHRAQSCAIALRSPASERPSDLTDIHQIHSREGSTRKGFPIAHKRRGTPD